MLSKVKPGDHVRCSACEWSYVIPHGRFDKNESVSSLARIATMRATQAHWSEQASCDAVNRATKLEVVVIAGAAP